MADEVQSEVKTEIADPVQYLTLGNLPKRHKRKHDNLLAGLHHQSQPASNTTEAQPISPSISILTLAAKRQHVTSTYTLTLLTLL
jgi:hypothetical protein